MRASALLVLVGGLTGLGFGASGPSLLPVSAGSVAGYQRADDLAYFRALLLDASLPESVRVGAAERLLRLGGAESRELLARMLSEGPTSDADIIVDALDVFGGAVPASMVEPLVASLRRIDPARGATAGRVLWAIEPQPIGAVSSIASAASEPSRARLAAIAALGALRSEASLASLIELLRRDPPESEIVRAAACAALASASGRAPEPDPAKWLSWWSARDAGERVDTAEQLAAARERMRVLEEQRATTEQRLVLAIERLFLALPPTERDAALRGWLTEDLAAVRLAGVGLIDRQLRNGTPPDAEIVLVMDRLLEDPDSTIRTRVPRLLVALAPDNLGARLAERAAAEEDPEIVRTLFEQIAVRPDASAFEPARVRLADPLVGSAAAKALARLVEARAVPANWVERVNGLVLALHDREPSASTAFLLAAGLDAATPEIASESETRALAALASDDPAMRRAVARGFARAERTDVVLANADDVAVMPVALDVLATGPADASTFDRLLAIEAPDELAEAWSNSVRRVFVRLPAADLAAADAAVVSNDRITSRQRQDWLEALVADAEAPAAVRTIAARALATTLSAGGSWRNVSRVLGAPGLSLDDDLRALLLEARARQDDFAGAFAVLDDPDVWMQFFDRTTDEPFRRTLAERIAERYGDRLDEAVRNRLALAAAGPASGDTTPGSGSDSGDASGD